MNSKVCEIITDRILAELEKGNIPWRKPWSGNRPANLSSKKDYRGVNVLLLTSMGYSSRYWLTYRQAQELGGNVRKGEKGTPIVFWKWLKKTRGENGETKTDNIPLLRYYKVFNVAQIEGIDSKIPEEKEFQPLQKPQEIIDGMPNRPTMEFGGDRACYSPFFDKVTLPHPETFKTSEDYYSVAYHELIHSTGYQLRLNRFAKDKLSSFGSENYSKEELVAELGSAFLRSEVGIGEPTLENSVAYLQAWLKALRNDKKMIVFASAQAQKATDYIMNKTEEN